MEDVEFRVLGPFEVRGSAGPIEIPSAKQRALLALLVLHPGESLGTERLTDELWGDDPPASSGHAIEVYVSALRRVLGRDRIETHGRGYRLRAAESRVDLRRFEALASEGRAALVAGNAPIAAERFVAALALWRGPALADLAVEHVARAECARLDELREFVLEQRIDADLACGRHLELVPELHQMVAEAPLNEAFQARLMLALYRSGRQADALEVYRRARAVLIAELGVEPGPELAAMQQAILAQDGSIARPPLSTAARDQSPVPLIPGPIEREVIRELIVTGLSSGDLDEALRPGIGMAMDGRRGLLVALLVPPGQDGLAAAAADLRARRAALEDADHLPVRTAAFTTTEWGRDLAGLAARTSADLVIVGGSRPGHDGALPRPIIDLLGEASVQVALVLPSAWRAARSLEVEQGPIVVPFGGSDHDWAALELGAWLARGRRTRLVVAGLATTAPARGRPDASRLIADACLIVQRALRVDAEPLLVEPTVAALVRAGASAAAVVLGMPERWHTEGVGPFRMSVAAGVPGVVLAVRQGPRPSGLAPADALSRYTWSIRPALTA